MLENLQNRPTTPFSNKQEKQIPLNLSTKKNPKKCQVGLILAATFAPKSRARTELLCFLKPPPKSSLSPSSRHLNALAVIAVFSATDLVPPEDITFVVFSLIFIYFIPKFFFPYIGPSPEEPVFDTKNKLFRLYMLVATLIGLLLPIAYIILKGIFEGDKEGIKAASPHVILLASQVFAEGLTFPGRRSSSPVKVFVPVLYDSLGFSRSWSG